MLEYNLSLAVSTMDSNTPLPPAEKISDEDLRRARYGELYNCKCSYCK
jgi:hypothetical protein